MPRAGFRARDELENIFQVIEAEPTEFSEVDDEFGRVAHDAIDRLRPHPYDVTEDLVLTDGGALNTFPAAYTELIPKGTYDFGDSPNHIRMESLGVELLSANDVFLVEFYQSPDGVVFTPVGAVRNRRSAAFTRTFYISAPVRPINIDEMGLYGRLKTASGAGNTATLSLSIARYLIPGTYVPISTGAWPYG